MIAASIPATTAQSAQRLGRRGIGHRGDAEQIDRALARAVDLLVLSYCATKAPSTAMLCAVTNEALSE
ncbi:hypothetical protein [Actinotalea subterranea]|uniref:hypothetical protein n=1 Tax=Actinotalea subterranea TaxID=2607497 RepID=UPI00165D6A53|nr:hypothetical protein [Actinotalea subterranea]